jgi:hypothetical protein
MTPVSDNSRTTSNDITRPFEACPGSFFPTHLIGRHKKATFCRWLFCSFRTGRVTAVTTFASAVEGGEMGRIDLVRVPDLNGEQLPRVRTATKIASDSLVASAKSIAKSARGFSQGCSCSTMLWITAESDGEHGRESSELAATCG